MTLSLQMVGNLLQRIKDLEQELSTVKSSIAEVESKPVVTKWQPKGGIFYIGAGGSVSMYNSREHTKLFGMERDSREHAERIAVEMRKFNRLLALRDELCGEVVFDWFDEKNKKYCIYFDHKIRKWNFSTCVRHATTTPYFATEESAQRACKMLNSGEVEL